MSSVYENELDAFEIYHKLQEDSGSQSSGYGSTGIGLPALGHALAGSAGTAISHILLYPLDLAITRLQVQSQLRGPHETPSAALNAGLEYKDLPDAVHKIYASEGGLSAFYAGCLTDTSKSILDAFLFFLAYNFFRQQRRASTGSKHLSVPSELAIGMLAGAVSKAVTTPVQQIVTRIQTSALVDARNPDQSGSQERKAAASISGIARSIYGQKGLKGFWAGYSASLILTLNPALTFFFQNMLRRILVPSSTSKSNRPQSAALVFFIAALSKAVASSVTYPFSVAKTRAQVASSSNTRSDAQQEPTKSFKSGSYSAKDRPALSARGVLPPVISSLYDVYRSQGIFALYSGLSGELVKGFMGHGLTMALKDRIHVLIVSAYFMSVKFSKRWSEGEGNIVAKDAGLPGSIRDEALREVARVRALIERAADEVSQAVDVAKDSVVGTLKP